ncbi:hypothetical protein [Phenylobacterium sp.]|uniref:hypothetical protein n=1 Tax=Phenylobacterium sp. TaxID=1871053 RepID=UPI0025DAC6D6|nr:hypothetical protein [Phenylobacterium sp.]
MSVRALARRVAARVLRRGGEDDRALVAAEFDAAYYLAANPDVAATGADPLSHFLAHGWREGRDPHARFSIQGYLDNNPDVAQAGVNPFAHFLKLGRHEARPTTQGLGFRYQAISRLLPIEAQIAAAAATAARVPLASADGLVGALGRSRTGLRDLHVTFSHDDYRQRVGGLQLCLHQEAARIAGLGRDHLHLHPATPWPVLRTAGEPAGLEVLLNGESLGVHGGEAIARALGQVAGASGGARSLAIHSLLGHAVEDVLAIAGAVGLSQGFYWLHDYASLCAGFHLLRDGVEDCGAPPPDSPACSICVYGPARARHLAAHEALFQALSLTVVSPSDVALDVWREGWLLPAAETVVHPHARLIPRGPAPTPPAGPLRIAYVGFPVAHKGWPVFRELALAFEDDPRYAFLHLGAQPEPGLPVAFHSVRVDGAHPRAMIDALEAHAVDVVLLWPLWRETFSFAAYEALAAGCAVVAGPDSGNIAALVAREGAGWVLPDEPALAATFTNGRILELSRATRRPMLYDLPLSGMTSDLIAADTPA